MQDGASPHTARATCRYFNENGIPLIRWPAYSPDLNPIENVWKVMKDWIARNYSEYTEDQTENKQIVQEAWDALPQSLFHNLVASMPARMQAVVDANGLHINY